MYICTPVLIIECIWRSEDNLQELVCLLHLVGSGDWTPIARGLYPLRPRGGWDFSMEYLGCWNGAKAYSARMLSSSSTSSRNLLATNSKASVGQDWNQSIVQQLMSEGNILRRVLKASPIGLMANETQALLVPFHKSLEKQRESKGFQGAGNASGC